MRHTFEMTAQELEAVLSDDSVKSIAFIISDTEHGAIMTICPVGDNGIVNPNDTLLIQEIYG